MFFFEKKNQKTFVRLVPRRSVQRGSKCQKVFCFFFSKKKSFLSFHIPTDRSGVRPVKSDVVIVGAGPYGLSLAAHLQAQGVKTRIFGRPMDTWMAHMPAGMHLKSEGFASNLADPQDEWTLRTHCKQTSQPYQDTGMPVPLKCFQDYGLEFQRRWVPDLDQRDVARIEQTAAGFAVTLADGERLITKKVVLAIGITHYAYIPDQLGDLPGNLVSHSSDHADLSRFKGRRVMVVGAGASALDTLKLLLDASVDAELVARKEVLRFHAPPSKGPRPLIDRIRAPMSGLGPGWRSRLCTDAPLVFHAMPEGFRHEVVRRHLGPAPCWWTNSDPVLHARKHLGTSISQVRARGGMVELDLAGASGERTVSVDHVIAGTGYRVDLGRLHFLAPGLRANIQTEAGSPRLSANFQSSVPGIYFVGLSSAASFGPMTRFAFGARFTARRLSRHLARTAAKPSARHEAFALAPHRIALPSELHPS
jgi:cation diffusion facilitator CzcD-associated flavoprotein CzcO